MLAGPMSNILTWSRGVTAPPYGLDALKCKMFLILPFCLLYKLFYICLGRILG